MLEADIIEPVEKLEWISHGSTGQETRKRDHDMRRLEEFERCMPT
jgi:hypothetical protein